MKTTFCPRCRMIIPVDTYLNADHCPGCGRDFNVDYYRFVAGFAVVTAAFFLGLAFFSPDPQRWRLVRFMSVAAALWAGLIIMADQMLNKLTGLSRGARHWITISVASGLFLLLLVLCGGLGEQ